MTNDTVAVTQRHGPTQPRALPLPGPLIPRVSEICKSPKLMLANLRKHGIFWKSMGLLEGLRGDLRNRL